MTNLIVLGMHRSGTSAVAGALSACGYYMGPDLLPAIPNYNDSGFFESHAVIEIHDEFFNSLGVDWRYCYRLPKACFVGEATDRARKKIQKFVEQLGSNQPWCLKDPRMSVLLPLWQSVLAELEVEFKTVICLRNPSEVAASLTRRDGLTHDHGLLLWFYYQLCAERYSREQQRSFINYADLIASPAGAIKQISADLGVEFSIPVESQLGVEGGWRHVDGCNVEVPEYLNQIHDVLSRKAVDLDPLNNAWEMVFPILSMTPDIRALEGLAATRLSDLELSRKHAENLKSNFAKEKQDLMHTVAQVQVCVLEQKETIQQLQKSESTLRREVEGLESRLEKQGIELGLQATELSEMRQEKEKLSLELESVRASYNSVLESKFWRATEPARKLVQRLRLATVKPEISEYSVAFKPDRDIQIQNGRYIVTGASPRLELVAHGDTLPDGEVEFEFDVELTDEGLQMDFVLSDGTMSQEVEIIQNGSHRFQLMIPAKIQKIFVVPLGQKSFDISSCTLRRLN